MTARLTILNMLLAQIDEDLEEGGENFKEAHEQFAPAEVVTALREIREALVGLSVPTEFREMPSSAEVLERVRAELQKNSGVATLWQGDLRGLYGMYTNAVGVIRALEFCVDYGKCPACRGWNVTPQGETPKRHTADCRLAAVLTQAGAPSAHDD